MRVVLRRQEQGQIGATVGGVGAAAAVTAAGAPELIPLAVPIGAQAGEYAEKGIRSVVKKEGDPCEDLGFLGRQWDGLMESVVRYAGAGEYEKAEDFVVGLINLDARILRAVNCLEARR